MALTHIETSFRKRIYHPILVAIALENSKVTLNELLPNFGAIKLRLAIASRVKINANVSGVKNNIGNISDEAKTDLEGLIKRSYVIENINDDLEYPK